LQAPGRGRPLCQQNKAFILGERSKAGVSSARGKIAPACHDRARGDPSRKHRYGLQLDVQASADELIQSAQVRSGPVQLAGWPSHETIGQAHQVFQAWSQGAVSSSLPHADSTKPKEQMSNETEAKIDLRISRAK
jgi:hypothetical protein